MSSFDGLVIGAGIGIVCFAGFLFWVGRWG